MRIPLVQWFPKCSWWTLSGTYCAWQRPPTTHPTTFHVRKPRCCQCSFRLLMMGGVSPETCWASYKYGLIKVWYIVASCWILLYEFRRPFPKLLFAHHQLVTGLVKDGWKQKVRRPRLKHSSLVTKYHNTLNVARQRDKLLPPSDTTWHTKFPLWRWWDLRTT
jgi:hypothetical protein